MSGSHKKICYLIDTLHPYSGWGRLANEVINRVEKICGYETVILTRVSAGDSREHAVLAPGFWGIARSVWRVRRIMGDCDIVHAFDGWPNSVIAYFACLFFKKPLYITAVGTYSVLPLDFSAQGFVLRKAYRAAKKIFAISHYTKQQILKRLPLRNIETVNLGVDFEKFHRAYRDPVAKKNIILSVGEIKARKGYRVAIEAVIRLREKIPNIIYMIVGGGNKAQTVYFRELQTFVAEHGAQNNILFLGDVSEEKLLALYAEAKIFLLPSLEVGGAFEGFGLVLLEANAAGIPVIGTTPSGMDDIIIDGQNGFLVRQGDASALAEAMGRLCEHPSLLKVTSEYAVARAREFSWERTAARYVARYAEAAHA